MKIIHGFHLFVKVGFWHFELSKLLVAPIYEQSMITCEVCWILERQALQLNQTLSWLERLLFCVNLKLIVWIILFAWGFWCSISHLWVLFGTKWIPTLTEIFKWLTVAWHLFMFCRLKNKTWLGLHFFKTINLLLGKPFRGIFKLDNAYDWNFRQRHRINIFLEFDKFWVFF